MPPMVIDTAAVTGTKRNGLLIYSIQRNSFLYWDSTGSRWSRIAANLDTLLLSTRAWRQKGDDSLAAIINTRTDTVNLLSTKAWRQKGIDSVVSLVGSGLTGTGISGYMTRWSGTKALDTSQIFQNSAGEVLLGTTSDNGNFKIQVAGSIYSTTGAVLAASSGNVGIGGTSAPWKLTVNGADMTVTSSGTNISVTALSGDARIRSNKGMAFDVNTTLTTAMYIDTSRFVGINTFFPIYLLDVAGSLRNTTNAFFNTTSGESYFGTTTDAGDYRVQVNGNQLVSGHIDVNTSGTTARISTRRPTSATGNNIWIGGGGASASYTSGSHGSFNTSLGMFALEGSTTGFSNVAIGYESMRYATTGNGNVAVGGASLLFNGSGYSNVSIGGSSMFNNSSGYENSGIGSVVMNQNTTGYRNTAIGTGSIYRNTTGYMNVAIGYYAGDDNNTTDGNMTGYNNVFIGAETRPDTSNNNNSIVIGYKAIGRGSNTVVIGNSSITNNYFSGYISTGAPTGGSSKPWELGEAATVSPTSPNRTIRVEIDGVVYYLHAKTTND